MDKKEEDLHNTRLGDGSANRRTISRSQEAASGDLSAGRPLALDKLDIDALEAGVRPLGAAVPRVPARLGPLERSLVSLCGAAPRIKRGDVLGEGARDAVGARELEPDAAVLVGRVAREGECAGLLVVREAFGRVAEGDAVGHDVVRLGRAAAAQLEPVAVALEGGEVPSVDAVAPRDGVLDRDWGCELPFGCLLLASVLHRGLVVSS